MEPGSGSATSIASSIRDFKKMVISEGYDLTGEKEEDKGIPHDGLILSLDYLGVEDLLSVSRVCKTLHFDVHNDPMLWRCIHILPPLNTKIQDDALQRLCLNAQGNLECLSLNDCWNITDDGLRKVIQHNPKLQKLSVVGCIKVSMDGLINSLKALKNLNGSGIKKLKVGSCTGSSNHYEVLKSLVGGDEGKKSKGCRPRFYHLGASTSIACNNVDGRALDIELCPRCQKCTLVFDCPGEICKRKGGEECRACVKCIERCVKCGRCVKDCRYTEDFFNDCVCQDCLTACNEEE